MGADQPDDASAGARARPAGREHLTWDQSRQAWVPPGGLLPPPQPGQSFPGAPVTPQPRPHSRRGLIIVTAVVVIFVVVAVAATIGAFRHFKTQDSAALFEVPSATSTPSAPTPLPSGATTPAPPPAPSTPTSPPPNGSTASQHEVHYLAGASSTRADIVIRRSSGKLDEQHGLAMPLQSKLGADHLTVHLATGTEAVIRVVTPAANDTVWCSITVDGQTRVSTVQANDHHITTCSVKIIDDVDSDTNA